MKVAYVTRGEAQNAEERINFSLNAVNREISKVAMPRGSKPGERRGGRQCGTPNKKTALRNAAISAAAANPNTSPLDFLLGLMRDPNLSIEYRVKVAITALPFVHTKAAKPEDDRASTKYGHNTAGVNASGHGFLKAPPRVRMKRVAGSSAAEGSPLAFLMGVMRDPDAPPHLRVQVARAIAPYVHWKSGVSQPEVVIDDEYGFVIDPAAARALRDDDVEEDRLICTGKFLGTEAERKFRDRIAEKKKALANGVECPRGYTALDAREDGKRVESLQRKRVSQRPHKLTAEEDAEEAHLIARVAVYHHTSPEAQARKRISKLTMRSFLRSPGMKLSDDERSELDSLRARYPDLPEDPDDPMKRSSDAIKAELKRLCKDKPNEQAHVTVAGGHSSGNA